MKQFIFIVVLFIETEVIFMLTSIIPIIPIFVPFVLLFFINKYMDYFLEIKNNKKNRMQIIVQCTQIIAAFLLGIHYVVLQKLNVLNQTLGVGTGKILFILSCCWYIIISFIILVIELIRIRKNKYDE